MKLRSQGVWLVVGAAGGFFALVLGVAGWVLLPAADEADRHDMRLRLRRLENRIEQRTEQVRVYAGEYGPWTDTAQLIAGKKPEFVEENLHAEHLQGAGISLVAVWDATGRRVVSMRHDAATEVAAEAGEDLLAKIEAWPGLAQREVGKTSDGVLATPAGLLLFSAQPVTENDRLPPSRGTFFAGVFLDVAMLAELAAGEDHNAVLRPGAGGEEGAAVRFIGPNKMSGSWRLLDPEGAVVGEIVLTAERYARSAQMRSLGLIVVALGAGGVLLAWVFWRLLDRRFLRRMEILTRAVGRLEGEPETRSRLAAEAGDDELAQLARATGKMSIKLADARAEAEAATRAKADFLASMSHEIRTPLNGVIGYLGLLRATPLTPEQAEHVRVIEESGETLIGVINEILDFSKLESGKVQMESIPTDVAGTAEEVMTLFRPQLEAKGVAGRVVVETGAEGRWLADPLRVRQVLNNLVSNAVKFTVSGEVTVRVGLPGAGADGVRREGLRVSVRDSGIGMTAEQKAGLFRPFAQADYSTTRRYGGTGLGLAISLRLVRAWGGELTATSEAGEGSEFEFTLPAKRAVEPERAPAKTETGATRMAGPSVGKLRILMAEDTAVNARLLTEILRRFGQVAEQVTNGRAALEAMAAREFDLVFMDVQMPELDGMEATRRQRRREKAEGLRPVLIVALTANALAGAREECLEAGMDEYLAKPFQMSQVAVLLERAEQRARAVV